MPMALFSISMISSLVKSGCSCVNRTVEASPNRLALMSLFSNLCSRSFALGCHSRKNLFLTRMRTTPLFAPLRDLMSSKSA